MDLGAVPSGAIASVGVVPTQDVTVQNVQPPPGEGPEFGKASPVALVVILVLGLAMVLLIVSMTRHLKKLPASFDTDPPAEDAGDTRG